MSIDRRRRSARRQGPLRAGLRTALEAMTDAPAMVLDDHLDVVATNPLGRALLAPVLEAERPNLARFVFLDEDVAASFYPEWERVAAGVIQGLRTAAARDPRERALHRLIGELSTRSLPFRERWSATSAPACRAPREAIDHPVVGPLVLLREELAPISDPRLVLVVLTAQPGSTTEERLRILASWAQAPARIGVLGQHPRSS